MENKDVKCGKCKSYKYPSQFLKEGRTMKTCSDCRDRGKKYRDQNLEKERERERKYEQSEQGKETRAKYQESESYKLSQKKYSESEHGKETRAKYRQSEACKAKRAEKVECPCGYIVRRDNLSKHQKSQEHYNRLYRDNIRRCINCPGLMIEDYSEECRCRLCEDWGGCSDPKHKQYYKCEKCDYKCKEIFTTSKNHKGK